MLSNIGSHVVENGSAAFSVFFSPTQKRKAVCHVIRWRLCDGARDFEATRG